MEFKPYRSANYGRLSMNHVSIISYTSNFLAKFRNFHPLFSSNGSSPSLPPIRIVEQIKRKRVQEGIVTQSRVQRPLPLFFLARGPFTVNDLSDRLEITEA